MLSNEIIYYIDEYVTLLGCNITSMEVINHLREKYQREFDLPTIFHHLSQRFKIQHKCDNVEFVKDLIKEVHNNEVLDPMYDEYSVY
jgi:hypothetical protein